uniref:Uncharacterized protein n=1 Tax=Tanacetum cinerariifolium TaxID=118510 RepID=A0A699GWK4_TANCI|nr:hypothetical protein [Tanacetum cinerariifolium]
MAIEEVKDLVTLPLDELIENLKVYEMILEIDGVASKTTKESDEDVDKEEAEAFNLIAKSFHKSSARIIDLDVAIDSESGLIDSKEVTVIVLGAKEVKDHDKIEAATIAKKKVTS